MLISRMDFPVRPARGRGESLASYVCRFYWENGHEVPNTLQGPLRDLYLGDKPGTAFIHLRAAVGALDAADREWWVTRRLDMTTPDGLWFKWRRFHYSPIRYCPACLKESGFHAELWMLPLVEACPLHQCALVSRCVVCGQPLRWSALRPAWRCVCGAVLATAASHPAAPWETRLASILASAADFGRLSGEEDAPLDRWDAIHDAYDFLGWAHIARRQLSRRSYYELGPRWGIRPNPSAHSVPGAWEERLLLTEASTCKQALLRLLKWNFRCHAGMLVLRHNEGPLALAKKALGGLPINRYSAGLHSQAEELLGGLSAGIKGTEVYFHPRFCDTDRRPYLAAFARWWHTLANRISVLEPLAQLSSSYLSGSWFDFGNRDKLVVQILNALLDAASRDKDVERYVKLTARWDIPEQLQRKLDPNEILSEVGGYLSSLRSSELAFVLDLLNDAEGHTACQ